MSAPTWWARRPDLAVSLQVFLICWEHHDGHTATHYELVTEAGRWIGPDAIAAVVAAADRAGALCPQPYTSTDHHSRHLAVLDILDEDGDVVDDRCIPDQAALDWWRRGATFVATSSDCEICEPAAYSAIRAGFRGRG